MCIHSYLHKWSIQASNGVLDVNGQNLEIEKYSKIKRIQLIF